MTTTSTANPTITQTVVTPYINFDGKCDEALRFYEKALGAQTECLMRFSEMPETEGCGELPAGSENKVMHCQFRVGGSVIMASDCSCTGQSTISGISLSIAVESAAKAQKLFSALAESGKVQMPLDKTFFAESFGVVEDRFGVTWMIIAGPTA